MMKIIIFCQQQGNFITKFYAFQGGSCAEIISILRGARSKKGKLREGKKSPVLCSKHTKDVWFPVERREGRAFNNSGSKQIVVIRASCKLSMARQQQCVCSVYTNCFTILQQSFCCNFFPLFMTSPFLQSNTQKKHVISP